MIALHATVIALGCDDVSGVGGRRGGGGNGGGSAIVSADERKVLVQAAIVRTLKHAGRMAHADLMGEISKTLAPRLVPEASLVRKCIEYLIDREYVARHDSNRDVYVYVP